MWIVLHTYFIRCNEEEEEEHPDRISTAETGHVHFVNDITEAVSCMELLL